MSGSSPHRFDRRRFLAGSSALGVASVLGSIREATAEPPPEIVRIRLIDFPAICLAPLYLAEELLHLEGFTQVEYVPLTANAGGPLVAAGQADIAMDTPPSLATALDGDSRIVALGGIHAGCYELFAHDRVRAIRDLKGKSVAITALGSNEHVFVSSILAYVGIDPTKDIRWVVAGTPAEVMRLFQEERSDAFLGFAPQPQELREKKIGRAILSTTHDRPWSNYFCCMPIANREFIRKYPVAAKRALRALLKSADACAEDPQRAARYMATKGFAPYPVAQEVLTELPYRRWREANPEDSLRFYALRLHEVGMIKSTPQKLIAQGTDFRFFNELKQELKA